MAPVYGLNGTPDTTCQLFAILVHSVGCAGADYLLHSLAYKVTEAHNTHVYSAKTVSSPDL